MVGTVYNKLSAHVRYIFAVFDPMVKGGTGVNICRVSIYNLEICEHSAAKDIWQKFIKFKEWHNEMMKLYMVQNISFKNTTRWHMHMS